MVHSAASDTNFLYSVTGLFEGDTLARFIFTFCQGISIDLVKESVITFKKKGTNQMTPSGKKY